MTGKKLADGEGTGGSVTIDVFPKSSHTYGYHRFAQRITGASSSVSMVARRWRAVVLWPSPATTWPGERGYSIYKP